MENNYYSSSRSEMLKYVPADCKVLLEIGCGEGNFSKLCKEKTGAYIIGIEYNKKAGLIARKKIDEVLIGDANEIIQRLPDKSIDLVILNDVLEHIAYPDLLIASVRNKMVDKGLILASIPNFRYISNLKHVIWDKNFKYERDGGIRDYTHLRFFTRKSIISFFKEMNFEILELDGIHPFHLNSFKQYMKYIAIRILGQNDSRYLQFAVLCKLQ